MIVTVTPLKKASKSTMIMKSWLVKSYPPSHSRYLIAPPDVENGTLSPIVVLPPFIKSIEMAVKDSINVDGSSKVVVTKLAWKCTSGPTAPFGRNSAAMKTSLDIQEFWSEGEVALVDTGLQVITTKVWLDADNRYTRWLVPK